MCVRCNHIAYVRYERQASRQAGDLQKPKRQRKRAWSVLGQDFTMISIRFNDGSNKTSTNK